MSKAKNTKMTIITRLENGDSYRIYELVSIYREPHTMVEAINRDNEAIEITFVTRKSCEKSFKRDLKLLNFIGIEGIIKK